MQKLLAVFILSGILGTAHAGPIRDSVVRVNKASVERDHMDGKTKTKIVLKGPKRTAGAQAIVAYATAKGKTVSVERKWFSKAIQVTIAGSDTDTIAQTPDLVRAVNEQYGAVAAPVVGNPVYDQAAEEAANEKRLFVAPITGPLRD